MTLEQMLDNLRKTPPDQVQVVLSVILREMCLALGIDIYKERDHSYDNEAKL